MKAKQVLPVEVVFTPRWWHKHAKINFDEDYFFDPKRRVHDEMIMRHYLYKRFKIKGLGDEYLTKKPIIGPVQLAAGFIIPQLFGCEIKFHLDGSPDVIPLNLTNEQVLSLKTLDIYNTYPMNKMINMMDVLEKEFGYIEGDIDWNGVLNHGLDLRGQQLFIDMMDDSPLVTVLFNKIYETMIEFVSYIMERTGTTSTAVNRQTINFDKPVTLHSNCAVQMISNEMYEKHLLQYDQKLANLYKPYGIHHCGDNMENVIKGYQKVKDATFFDVGYGSDIAMCRKYLPDAFLNLRLSPVKILTCSPKEVKEDIIRLVKDNGGIHNAGICCINMDENTKDENIAMIYETANELRK